MNMALYYFLEWCLDDNEVAQTATYCRCFACTHDEVHYDDLREYI